MTVTSTFLQKSLRNQISPVHGLSTELILDVVSLTNFVNAASWPIKITLKYFTIGHTFMSADSFHRKVEKEMKDIKEVCDWDDFMKCVERSGHIYEMKIEDFGIYDIGLSKSQ